MPSFTIFAATGSLLLSSATATFDASSSTNVAVYWGQGANQPRLSEFCNNTSIDIINIAFLNVFPDQGAGGYPGTNFGNACGSETYTHNNISTALLSNCPTIGSDILTCQAAGKKIFLSLGGAYPTNQYIASDEIAKNFANFLWGAFGPQNSTWVAQGNPRPFGTAAVDGFDFDIESMIAPADITASTPSDYMSRGYATLAATLKDVYFPMDQSKSHYLSAAPQCVVPDAHLAAAIALSWFDFIFVQFYNTPQCSARANINKLNGGSSTNDITFDQWVTAPSKNPNVKIFLGLPASATSVYDASYYLTPAELMQLINEFQHKYPTRFGGVMLFEATSALHNVVNNQAYYDIAKAELLSSLTRLPSSCTNMNCTTTASSIASATPSSSIVPVSSDTIVTTTIRTTDILTITSCASKVISCPIRTHTTSYLITTVITLTSSTTSSIVSPSMSSSSSSTGTESSKITSSSVVSPSMSSSSLASEPSDPASLSLFSKSSTAIIYTTVVIHIKTTTCPAGQTVTSGTKISILTSDSTSVVTSTETKIITCTDPVCRVSTSLIGLSASATSAGRSSTDPAVSSWASTSNSKASSVPEPAASSVPFGSSSTSLGSSSTFTGASSTPPGASSAFPNNITSYSLLHSSKPSTLSEATIYTTEYVYTTSTTCPAGQTITSGSMTIVLSSEITSVITKTSTATITCSDPACVIASSTPVDPATSVIPTASFSSHSSVPSSTPVDPATSITFSASEPLSTPSDHGSPSHGWLHSSKNASAPSNATMYTAEYLYTTTTTCPAGHTITSGDLTTVLTSPITSIVTKISSVTVTCSGPACVVPLSTPIDPATSASPSASKHGRKTIYTTIDVYSTISLCPSNTSGVLTYTKIETLPCTDPACVASSSATSSADPLSAHTRTRLVTGTNVRTLTVYPQRPSSSISASIVDPPAVISSSATFSADPSDLLSTHTRHVTDTNVRTLTIYPQRPSSSISASIASAVTSSSVPLISSFPSASKNGSQWLPSATVSRITYYNGTATATGVVMYTGAAAVKAVSAFAGVGAVVVAAAMMLV